MKLFFTTLLALLAFAGNSVVCRLALAEGSIDATSFSVIRLLSGAVALLFLVMVFNSDVPIKSVLSLGSLRKQRSWYPAFLLWLYAFAFSFAYIELGAAAGALILFASVQLTLTAKHKISGQPTHAADIVGLLLAFSGLIYWLGPSAAGPSLFGTFIMVIAGIAWAGYTYLGMTSRLPAQIATTRNFVLSIPFAALSMVTLFWMDIVMTGEGLALAIFSGVVTSALGYWLWYQVLPNFTGLFAGVLQLSVPIIAAFGGIIINDEPITLAFVVAASLILFGIFFIIRSQSSKAKHV